MPSRGATASSLGLLNGGDIGFRLFLTDIAAFVVCFIEETKKNDTFGRVPRLNHAAPLSGRVGLCAA
ncbi:hypothetical protein ABUE31_03425 [Mesorhizobium sp. ZMM04-5]|uniref:Uncharacterized protein n=1 Tax=Mesorhizobium marinum TaxID=3228790 RepID=A0ABV3QVS9_9HYPH